MSSNLPDNWPAMSAEQAHAFITAEGSPLEMMEETVFGRKVRVYKNAPPNLRAVFEASRAFGDREFLLYEDERITYEAFYRAVLRLSNVLANELGAKKGDRVVLSMRNFPEWTVAFMACAVNGLIVTPLNAWGTGEELEYGFTDSGAKIGIVDGERAERIKPHLGVIKPDAIIVARGGDVSGENYHRFEDLVATAKNFMSLPAEGALPAVDLHPDDEMTIFYTSGTTGKPKGALGTHRNAITNVMNGLIAPARVTLMRGEIPVPPSPDDPQKVYLLSVPLFHVTGCHSIFLPIFAGGHKMVLMYRWDATKALQTIQDEKVTIFGGVPAMALQVLEHPEFDQYDVSSIENIGYGGAPAAADLPRRLGNAFSKAQSGQGYGMTETSALSTSIGGEEYVERPESCGVPVPVCDIKVCDEDGNPVAQGELGELWVYGPNIVKGYWGKPEETAKTFRDGWVVTGDIARVDEAGYVAILDRAKDMLIRGGENIYCVEVENVLYDHPRVMDAAVIGIPDPILGEEVGAIIQITPGDHVDEAELQAHVGQHLAKFKVPALIDIRTEPLPRNPNGKILKRQLRDEFSQALKARA